MKRIPLALLAILFFSATNANVTDGPSTPPTDPPVNTWTGTTSTDWSVSTNWSAGVPAAASNVDIPAAPSNQPVITNGTTALVNNLTIHTGASLTINTGGTLNVAPGGVFTNSGTFTNNGSFYNCTTPSAVITPSPNTTVLTCSTTSITLTASGGGSYLWDDNSTNASRVVTAAGNYSVTVTGGNGCAAVANVSITQDISTPSAVITPSPNTTVLTCATPSITLTASGGGSYLWDDNSTNASRVVSAAGNYSVTVTGANGCTAVANVSISGSSATLVPGCPYQGGIVAYILQPGDPGYVAGQIHGLIAATSDQSGWWQGIQWYNGSNMTTNATATALGTGFANTNTIITAQGATATNYAAGLARAYNGGGYTDWFLPSKDELNKLYINKLTVGGFSNTFYWSSSEYGSNDAWTQLFSNGLQFYDSKSRSYFVRAVRAF